MIGLARRALQRRGLFTAILHEPTPDAPRVVPTPLVYVSSTAWDPLSRSIDSHVLQYRMHGYTCLEVDIALPKTRVHTPQLMDYFMSELGQALKEARAFYPPVIIARRSAGMIAESYVGNHPATALVLLSPFSHEAVPSIDGTIPVFRFEPLFPIALVAEKEDAQKIPMKENGHRLVEELTVDQLTVPFLTDMKAAGAICEWLDEIGV